MLKDNLNFETFLGKLLIVNRERLMLSLLCKNKLIKATFSDDFGLVTGMNMKEQDRLRPIFCKTIGITFANKYTILFK